MRFAYSGCVPMPAAWFKNWEASLRSTVPLHLKSTAANVRVPNNRIARAAAIAAVLLVALIELSTASHDRMLLGDFRAFYCGGSTLLHGENPDAAAPILHCESVPQPFGLHGARDDVALPAPFPGYTLALFAIFALLPYVAAAIAWCA